MARFFIFAVIVIGGNVIAAPGAGRNRAANSARRPIAATNKVPKDVWIIGLSSESLSLAPPAGGRDGSGFPCLSVMCEDDHVRATATDSVGPSA